MSHFFKYKFVLTVLIFVLTSFAKHEEYYSITNIQYKENEKTLQITMRFFTNDMEIALQKFYGKSFELNTDREIAQANELIEEYIKQKFNLTIDGTLINYDWIGKEFEKDSIYLYFEVKNVEPFQSIEIRNACLIDAFPSQENIVKFKAFETYKSLVLNKQKDTEAIIF